MQRRKSDGKQPDDVPKILKLTRSVAITSVVALFTAILTIRAPYFAVIVAAYVMAAIAVLEVFFEPLFRKSRWLRVTLFALVVASTVAFTGFVPLASAPIELQAYLPPGGHDDKAEVNGIVWNHRFRDLRVTISNGTSDDYKNMDTTIDPEGWVYDAALVEGLGCQLSRAGGGSLLAFAKPPIKTSDKHTFTAMRSGNASELYDNVGNEYVTLASNAGFRLRCDALGAKSSVRLVFAVVDPDPRIVPSATARPDGLNLEASALKGVTDVYELLREKPTPKRVDIKGTYTSGVKPFSIDLRVEVESK